VINITPDEVVNQNLNAAGQPTGATVKDPKKTDTQPSTEVPSQVTPKAPEVEESLPIKENKEEALQPVTEELKEEASRKIVLSENQAQPLFMVVGLLALALSLAAFAAGTSMRFRRRKH
jgi:hypothetical protein